MLTVKRDSVDAWFKAYNLMFEMMDVRGFTVVNHERANSRAVFDYRVWPNISQTSVEADKFIIFTKDNVRLYFGYYINGVNKDLSAHILKFLEERLVEYNNPALQDAEPKRIAVQIEAVLVLLNITHYDARNNLKAMHVDTIPRASRDPHLARIAIRYFILDEEFQANPLKATLHSETRMIVNEAEKERLRLRLVQHEADKSIKLSVLLPKLPMDDKVARWYGAEVGDVFYFVRTIGGRTPYYRIVVPPVN